ncbi:hypothetical protein J6590_105287 [Homalodisca vitripennis]|nr:hypothetical protein J6590_105287 [Homalodisca vitripennis]
MTVAIALLGKGVWEESYGAPRRTPPPHVTIRHRSLSTREGSVGGVVCHHHMSPSAIALECGRSQGGGLLLSHWSPYRRYGEKSIEIPPLREAILVHILELFPLRLGSAVSLYCPDGVSRGCAAQIRLLLPTRPLLLRYGQDGFLIHGNTEYSYGGDKLYHIPLLSVELEKPLQTDRRNQQPTCQGECGGILPLLEVSFCHWAELVPIYVLTENN